MKLLPLVLALFLISPLLFAAEGDTIYISDIIYVPMRATPCDTCRIVHRGLVSGTQVTDMGGRENGWTQIVTAGGIEGWIPNQFVLTEQIARVSLPELEADLAALRAENGQLNAQLSSLMAELRDAGLMVDNLSVENEDGSVTQGYALRGDLTDLNVQNQELLRRNQLMQNELDILVAENERLADNRWRSWFIYGGLAVFAGAILSSLLGRLKKRRGFSEWA